MVPQGFHRHSVLQRNRKGFARVLQEFRKGFARVPQGFFKRSRIPQGFRKGSAEVLQLFSKARVPQGKGSARVSDIGSARVPQEFRSGSARVPQGFRKGCPVRINRQCGKR